jgi:hypothetical protein
MAVVVILTDYYNHMEENHIVDMMEDEIMGMDLAKDMDMGGLVKNMDGVEKAVFD